MPEDFFYDLDSARETLHWLKDKLAELGELGVKGENAMTQYDLDSAESYTERIHEILDEISAKKVIIRDLGEVLIDFPAVINNMPSYLCWTAEEEDVMYWHYADEGFAGRKPINGEENILSYL